MKKNLLLVAMFVAGALTAAAQGTWTAPAAPGQDPSTLDSGTDVYVYNIEAEAILTRGYNWQTKAIADQLENGDAAAGAGRQPINIFADGEKTIKIHIKDRDARRWFAQDPANPEGDASMWTDIWEDQMGDYGRFTYAASANYPNAYTLTNVGANKLLDVKFLRGGQTTLFNGKGFTDWTFVTPADVEAGKLRAFKARKAMWQVYKALENAGAVEANAAALATANEVYTNAEATADELRAAFRTLFVAVAASIEEPVDASYLFDNPDMAADKNMDAWNWEADDIAKYGAGEWERWHVPFTAHQTKEVPNGLYDVRFMGMYRLDGGDATAPKLTVTTQDTYEKNFPLMDDLAAYWNVSNGSDWVNCTGGQRPNQMWTASDALALDQASAFIDNVKVKEGSMDIKFSVSGGEQWFNWHRVIVTYKGAVGLALYKSLQAKIAEAEALNADVPESFLEVLTAALENAKTLTAASTEEELTAAINAIDEAINTVKNAPTNANIEILRATAELAKAEGIDVSVANNLIENVATATAASLDQALYDLRAARKIKAQGMKDIYTGSKPAAGKVYIFNVGTGLFLGTGSDWNTHAAVDQAGIEVELIDLDPAEENNFRIKTERGGGWLNWGGYVDTPYDDIWHFVPVEGKEGVYNISSTGNDGNLLGYDPNGATNGEKYWSTVAIDRFGFDNPMNQWKVITAAEREALIEKANAAAPVEVSYLIKNASLNRQDGYDMWTKECEGGNGGARVSTLTNNDGNRAENYGYEYFEPKNFSFTQNLEGLKPGVYEVSVNGFFRNGNGGAQAEAYNNGEEPVQLAYLFANDAKALLPNITSVMSKVPGATDMQYCNDGAFPNMPQSALEYFEYGYYKASVEVLVGEDGKLTLGVKKDELQQTGDWTMFDNFRLVYKGQPTEAVTLPKTWNFSNWTAGTIYPSIEVDGLTAVVNNPENTIDIDAHARSVDGVDYTQRLKLGGTGSENNRVLTFLAPGNFNIEVVLTSASTSRERTLNIATGEFSNVVATMTAAAGEVTKEMSSVQAELEEPVYIYSEKDGINLYAIYLKPYDETVTGITEVAAERMDGNVYNLQGQKVVATKKGLYIVDGKKVIMK
ncbi:MAG: hypothetical protein IJ176_03865 [Prevotella sp.]|nr:hypothetical protein [Prevotella sp.]